MTMKKAERSRTVYCGEWVDTLSPLQTKKILVYLCRLYTVK